ncbi:hypothetical protein NA56DRAFT_747920 [Hyaloscypha hepaticicola]|uniref:MADS-box domain-containing protein n=1 Tax=Hyaloscypha hepaticicola TaxID=2082293 RepID=A0A2J6Q8V9_9HELO|nr:hypothetical protein NA56DRAFT_747920 [Hyaloscypha hepaticicola]
MNPRFVVLEPDFFLMMAGPKLTKAQNKAYSGRSRGLMHKGYELAEIHSSISTLVFIWKGDDMLTFCSEKDWLPMLRKITNGVVRGPNFFVNAEDAEADGMLHTASSPTPQDEQRGRFIETLASQTVSLRKGAESTSRSSSSTEVVAQVPDISRTTSSLVDPLQEWMASVPVEFPSPLRKEGSKCPRENPSSYLSAEAGTPMTVGSMASPFAGNDFDISEPLSKRRKLTHKQEMNDFPNLQSIPEYPTPRRRRRSLATSQIKNPLSLDFCLGGPDYPKMR